MCVDELGSPALILQLELCGVLSPGRRPSPRHGWIAVRGDVEGEVARGKGGVQMDTVNSDWIRGDSCYSVHLSHCVHQLKLPKG